MRVCLKEYIRGKVQEGMSRGMIMDVGSMTMDVGVMAMDVGDMTMDVQV